jgi:photosystem II stability/assembly factor-like uncharacterized protein
MGTSLFVSYKNRRIFSVLIFSCASLSFIMIIQGCAQDDPVIPEVKVDEEEFWREYEVPFSRGYINSFDMDDDGTVYAIATGGSASYMNYYTYEIYVSANSGETWELRDFPEKVKGELIKSDHLGNVYFISEDCYEGNSIFRSSDGCKSWHHLNIDFELDYSYKHTLVFDSQNRGYLCSREGIRRTIDCGDSWKKIFDSKVNSMALDSEDALFAALDSILYRSEDNGNSWSPIEIPLGENEKVHQVVIDGTGRVYVVVFDYSEGGVNLYCSSDEGESWDLIQSWSHWWDRESFKLQVTPDNTLYFSMIMYLYRSNDHGYNWTELRSWYNVFLGSYFEMECGLDGEIMMSGGQGVLRSRDNGESWILVGLPKYSITGFTVGSDNRMWISSAYTGVYFSDDNFSTFHHLNNKLGDARVICMAVGDGDSLLVGTWEGVYKYSEDQSQWKYIGLSHEIVTCVYMAKKDHVRASVHAATSYGELYETRDDGENWSYLGMEGYTVNCMQLVDEGFIHVGTEYGGVFRYTGVGIAWDQLNCGLGSLRLFDFEMDSEGRLLAGTGDGIYCLGDGGNCWIHEGLRGKRVDAIYLAENGDLYAAASYRAYRRDAGCSEWKALGIENEFRGLEIESFCMDSEGYIFALGKYEKLWRSISPDN